MTFLVTRRWLVLKRHTDEGGVGTCLENQHFAFNGNAEQLTTTGLMAWRKLDNWTAFTDGYHTWINGPFGVQERLNTERYPGRTTLALWRPHRSK